MNRSGSGKTSVTILLLAGLALVCAVLAVWLGRRFEAATGGHRLVDLFLGNSQPGEIAALKALLIDPQGRAAARLFVWIYAGPLLLLPAALAGFAVLLLLRIVPGGRLYGKPVTPAILRAVVLLPLAYGAVHYADIILGLSYFTSADPDTWIAGSAPGLLIWLARTKMALLLVTAIVILRFVIIGRLASAYDDAAGL